MPDRKARSSDKSEVNFMRPITNIMDFGGTNDPCFGKHYSPSAPECRRCGDNELCVIAQAHLSKIKRQKLEDKIPFKDKEEVDIVIANKVKNLAITNNITSFIKIVKEVQTQFHFKTLLESKEATKKAIKSIKNLKLYKSKKDGKRKIKVVG